VTSEKEHTMGTRFLQIHTLTHYPASLLNRDDAGFAKRMPFGGAVRTRISSQCLKRHWRVYDGENSLRSIEAPESIRSRVAFERFIVAPLIEEGIGPRVARLATQKIMDTVFGSEAKKEKAQQKAGKKEKTPKKTDSNVPDADNSSIVEKVATDQVTVLGMPELEYLRKLALDAIKAAGGAEDKVESVITERMKDKKLRENIRALKPGSLEAGLGAALFGRMVTGDVLSATDAAIHVAHAMTVHGHMTESDYFTAIDDLVREEGEQGSGHINASELTSGLFYGYLVVDVSGLAKNLGDDRPLAGDVVHRLVHMVSTVSPGAKKGSTAPYAYSHLVLVESGKRQPRTLQNAFIEPVRAKGDLVQNAYSALRRHLAELDAMYGKSEDRAHAGLFTVERTEGKDSAIFENRMSLPDLADWARKKVAQA
jgi:CRISPR system Cascade subunit CasC